MNASTSAPSAARTALSVAVEGLEGVILNESSPGNLLSGEADLAVRFGVSRLTIREALKVLSARGLVDLGRGRRPLVRQQDSAVLSDYFAIALHRNPGGLLELLDIRRALEVLSASDAAASATAAGLAAIDAAVGKMDAAASSGADLEAYHAADLEFHAALALASGNRMLALVLESLEECMHESFRASAVGHFRRGGTAVDVIEAHRAIAAAVHRRDGKGAAAAMRRHLDEAAKDLRAVTVDGKR